MCVHARVFVSSYAYIDCKSPGVWLLKRHLLKDQFLHPSACGCVSVCTCIVRTGIHILPAK